MVDEHKLKVCRSLSFLIASITEEVLFSYSGRTGSFSSVKSMRIQTLLDHIDQLQNSLVTGSISTIRMCVSQIEEFSRHRGHRDPPCVGTGNW